MPYQSIIFSAAIADSAGNGPWVDIGQYGVNWSIHIQSPGSGTSVEISNQIPSPYQYTSQNPNVEIPQYPPYPKPTTITVYTAEAHSVPAAPGPYTITVTHPPTGVQVLQPISVSYAVGGAKLLNVPPPQPGQVGQYVANKIGAVNTPPSGVFTFNADDAGKALLFNYNISVPASGVAISLTPGPTNPYVLPMSGSGDLMVFGAGNVCAKWIRVLQATPGSTVAFLHIL